MRPIQLITRNCFQIRLAKIPPILPPFDNPCYRRDELTLMIKTT